MGTEEHRDNCRLCAKKDLERVLSLTPTPIGDDYVPKERLGITQQQYPLDLWLCRDCGHVQLLDVLDPVELFKNYSFETASSPGLVKHFRNFAELSGRSFLDRPDDLLLEIGSNDGTFLEIFQEMGYRVLGVDPAERIASKANQRGLPTISAFFDKSVAESIVTAHGKAKLIVANNVFAHADDLRGISTGIKTALASDGVFVFEVSYLVDILDGLLFDTIYHEHLCYHSVGPLKSFFESLNLELWKVERIPTKGGSIRCFVQHHGGARPMDPSVNELLKLETIRGVQEAAPFAALAKTLETSRDALINLLAPEAPETVAGFGASVTATTFLYHFGLQKRLSQIVDDNMSKAGLYSPGAHIPVLSSESLYTEGSKVRTVVILAWQYADAITAKHSKFVASGGRFVSALPNLRVWNAESK